MNEKRMSDGQTRIMRIEKPVECIILERVNRFVVKVLVDGKPQRAYIDNTGRLLQYLVRGQMGFCTNAKKTWKTDCRLFSVREDEFAAIVDTQLQMRAFEESLGKKLIPWLRESRILKGNAKLRGSIIDYVLEGRGEEVYLEVKSAILRGGEYAMYPDCPSLRGRKHVKELTEHVRGGGRSTILFIAALPEVKAFGLNRSADPELCGLLREACELGVSLRSIGLYYDPRDSSVYLYNSGLEVNLC